MQQEPVMPAPVAAAPHGAPLEFSGVAGVAQSSTLHGSQQLAATIAAPPLLGYWFALLDTQARKRALEKIGDEGAAEFETMMQAAMDGLGMERAGPAERLQAYDMKPQQAWAEQQAKFPRDWEEDWNDYQRLLARQAEGKL